MPGWRAAPAPAWKRAITLALTLCVSAAGFAAPARAETVVSLTFDDGQATQYAVKDLLASRGMRATFYVNSAKVGTSSFYMTWAQLSALAAAGNEIGGHTLTHANLTSTALTDAQKRAEVCDDRQNLIARGFNPVSFAYPHGAFDAIVQTIVRDCGYRTGRRVGGIVSPNWCPSCGSPHAESLPPADPFGIRTPSFGSDEMTLSAIQAVVTQAEFGGGWVPLVFHGVCTTACGYGWVHPSTLASLLDWLAARAAQGTVVRTMRAALEPAGPSDTTAPNTSITSGPGKTTKSSSATFAFTATEPGSSFECRLDGGSWTVCTSPTTYSGISFGSHTFAVRARDAAGNVDASPAQRSWKRRR